MDRKVTAYEKERQERIAKNHEAMRALQSDLEELLKPEVKAAPVKRGLASKRPAAEPAVSRRSLRLQGAVADGAYVEWERNGEVVVASWPTAADGAPSSKTHVKLFAAPPTAAPRDRFPPGDLPFASKNGSAAVDTGMLQVLASIDGKGGGRGGSASKTGASLAAIKSFTCSEEGVAKVVPSSTTHLAFLPSSSTLILAAADKRGNVGLWNVLGTSASVVAPVAAAAPRKRSRRGDPSAASTAPPDVVASEADPDCRPKSRHGRDGDGGDAGTDAAPAPVDGGGLPADADDEGAPDDGVLAFTCHHEYVSGLKWAAADGGPPSLFTGSYDGSVRRLDVAAGKWMLVFGDKEMEYSCMDLCNNTVLLGDKDGVIDVIDIRSGRREVAGVALQDRKVSGECMAREQFVLSQLVCDAASASVAAVPRGTCS